MARDTKIEDKPKIHVESIYIVVDELISTKEKPYFALLYKEVGAKNYNIGYASYDFDRVMRWKKRRVCESIVCRLCLWLERLLYECKQSI